MKKFALALLTCACVATPALACTGGQQWQMVSGKYLTDVTNDTPIILPGATVHFDFALFNDTDPMYGPDDVIPYDTAVANLMRGGDIVFTKTIPYQQDREAAGFDYEFPNVDAEYGLDIAYRRNGEDISKAHVEFVVGRGESTLFRWSWVIAGVIALGVLGTAMKLNVFTVKK